MINCFSRASVDAATPGTGHSTSGFEMVVVSQPESHIPRPLNNPPHCGGTCYFHSNPQYRARPFFYKDDKPTLPSLKLLKQQQDKVDRSSNKPLCVTRDEQEDGSVFTKQPRGLGKPQEAKQESQVEVPKENLDAVQENSSCSDKCISCLNFLCCISKDRFENGDFTFYERGEEPRLQDNENGGKEGGPKPNDNEVKKEINSRPNPNPNPNHIGGKEETVDRSGPDDLCTRISDFFKTGRFACPSDCYECQLCCCFLEYDFADRSFMEDELLHISPSQLGTLSQAETGLRARILEKYHHDEDSVKQCTPEGCCPCLTAYRRKRNIERDFRK